jgi:hypothetical protein
VTSFEVIVICAVVEVRTNRLRPKKNSPIRLFFMFIRFFGNIKKERYPENGSLSSFLSHVFMAFTSGDKVKKNRFF